MQEVLGKPLSRVAQGLLTGCEQRHRAFQPLLADITMWRNTHSSAEHPRDVERTEAGDTSQLSNYCVRAKVLSDVIKDATFGVRMR